MLDVENDLALNEQIVIERESVEREVHGALDRVLDSDEAEIHIAVLDRLEHLGDRAQRNQLTGREIGLAEHGLLGERAGRTQESDAHSCTVRG